MCSKFFKPIWEWIWVSSRLFKMVYPKCPWHLYALTVLVILSAILPYWRSNWFGGILDGVSHKSTSTALTATVWFMVLLALYDLIDKCIDKLTYSIDTRVKEVFASYFPRARHRAGMASFQRGRAVFNMLERAERAEYHTRFFVVQVIYLIGLLLNAAVGSAVILYHAPREGGILAGALLVHLYVQIRCAVKMSRVERDHWSKFAEITSTRNNFSAKERFKALLLFGIVSSLIKHLDTLAQSVYSFLRHTTWRLLPWEVLATLLLMGAYAWAIWSFVDQTLTGAYSLGQLGFLVSSLLALGLSLVRIIATVADQALGADKVVDVFRYMEAPVEEGGVTGGAIPVTADTPPEIRLENLSFAYEKGRPVLEGLSARFEAGRTTYLLGHNGSGKTTIFNLLSLLYQPPPRTIWIGDQDLSEAERGSVAALLKHLGQETLPQRFTPRQALTFAAGYGEGEGHICEELMWRALELACLDAKVRSFKKGLDEPMAIWNDATEDLSGGQARKLNIAMLMAAILTGRCRVVVLDEPWTGIDPPSAVTIGKNFQELGVTLIISTHTIERIRPEDRVVFLYREQDERGPTKRVFSGTHGEMLQKVPEYGAFCALF